MSGITLLRSRTQKAVCPKRILDIRVMNNNMVVVFIYFNLGLAIVHSGLTADAVPNKGSDKA
jgi:hypothetical protein